ncbi:hypothetical protein TNCV_730371 [Trichonephila clavipes]|nr:hypothetical protein TNCV_730371 [Trichonephila clavipes]
MESWGCGRLLIRVTRSSPLTEAKEICRAQSHLASVKLVFFLASLSEKENLPPLFALYAAAPKTQKNNTEKVCEFRLRAGDTLRLVNAKGLRLDHFAHGDEVSQLHER